MVSDLSSQTGSGIICIIWGSLSVVTDVQLFCIVFGCCLLLFCKEKLGVLPSLRMYVAVWLGLCRPAMVESSDIWFPVCV